MLAPGLRRHQPRGHRRAALLRDRGAGCGSRSTSRSSTTTSTAPRSSCSRALRNALRVVGKRSQDCRIVVVRRGRGRHGDHPAAAAAGPGRHRRGRHRGDHPPRPAGAATIAALGGRARPTPTAAPATCTTRCPAPTSSSASPRRTCCTPTTSRAWPTTRSSSRSPTPTPRSTPAIAQHHAAVVATGRSRLPQPDQQRARVPGRLPRAARRAGPRDHRRDAAGRRPRRSRTWSTEPNPLFIVPSVFDSTVSPAVASAVRRVSEAERDGSEAASVQEALDTGSASADGVRAAEEE